jgi:hypothetical protein
LFGEAGIPAIPFKGPAIAWPLYETPGLRFISDLDLLVAPRDAQRAIELLESNGYRRFYSGIPLRFFSDAGQMLMKRVEGAPDVDLHWRLAAAHFNPLDIEGIRARLKPIDIAGARMPTLCPEDLLAYLCVHGAKGGWSLAMVCDLDRLIGSCELDWDALLSRSARQRMARIVLLGLSLTQDLLGAKLPPEVSNRARADKRVAALAASVRERIHEGLPSGSQERGFLQFRLLQGARNRFRFFWYLLQPTDEDWANLHIPESLFFLYYLIKPALLAWQWRLRPAFGLNRSAGAA